jgi:hypothetical protein
VNTDRSNIVRVSTRSWSASLVPSGAVVFLLGIWAAIVALAGPTFSYGFDTGSDSVDEMAVQQGPAETMA